MTLPHHPGYELRDAGAIAAKPPSPPTPSFKEPQHDQKQDRTDSGRDDSGDDAGTEADAQPGEEPTADEGADDPQRQVSDKPKTGAAHDVSGKPSGDKAYE
jgi:hypothetical protein